MGNYILDFYCPSEKLCIELDGASHFSIEGGEYDAARTAYLNSLGITVIRFENKLVFDRIEAVLEEIKSNFKNSTPSRSAYSPLSGGELDKLKPNCSPPDKEGCPEGGVVEKKLPKPGW